MKAQKVEIRHPDKALFPDDEITKDDLAVYYERIAPYILPHILKRPLTLKHYPQGIGKDGFFSKHAPDHFPEFIARFDVPMRSKGGKKMQMVAANEAADLVYFAGQNVIELHMGLSKVGALEKPDQMILDLDPSDQDFEKVRAVAFALKALLDEQEVPSFIKTTGSRGVHIHIPLRAEERFEDVKETAKKLAEQLHERCPARTTLEKRKTRRGDKVFLDYLRNDYGMTAVAPYSLRALKHAPVATPIDWDELKDRSVGPQSYTLKTIFRRLSQKSDPWANFYKRKTDLPATG